MTIKLIRVQEWIYLVYDFYIINILEFLVQLPYMGSSLRGAYSDSLIYFDGSMVE